MLRTNTPTAAVDTHRDFIVDPEVLGNANENAELVPMVDRVEEATSAPSRLKMWVAELARVWNTEVLRLPLPED
jgi:hypothetical protein